MTSPPVPAPIAEALSRYPQPVRRRLLEIRELIFTVAAETEAIGPLTETLKWSEPAYFTEASGSGSTVRLGVTKAAPDNPAVLFNCKTTLIETFRSHFAGDFTFEGNRAVMVPPTGPLPNAPLKLCLHMALTYHRREGAGLGLRQMLAPGHRLTGPVAPSPLGERGTEVSLTAPAVPPWTRHTRSAQTP